MKRKCLSVIVAADDPSCTCGTKCTEDNVDTSCAVCSADSADA